MVAGEPTGRVRCTPNTLRLPQAPKGASFFAQQEAMALTSLRGRNQPWPN